MVLNIIFCGCWEFQGRKHVWSLKRKKTKMDSKMADRKYSANDYFRPLGRKGKMAVGRETVWEFSVSDQFRSLICSHRQPEKRKDGRKTELFVCGSTHIQLLPTHLRHVALINCPEHIKALDRKWTPHHLRSKHTREKNGKSLRSN